MATVATLPKTIFITTLPTSLTSSPPKIGMKRPFSLVSSSNPINFTLSQSPSLIQSPGPNLLSNNNFVPATRSYKYESIDDDYEFSDEQDYTESDQQPQRKRERLTHLTAEEKMYRRKLKNRIAAQTARDRKKALMVDLEDTVRRLEEENDTLLNENSKLRKGQLSLAEENEKLKKLLGEQQQEKQKSGSVSQDDARSTSTFGPAEFINVPLPKGQVKAEWALTWLVASALIQLCSKYCAKSLPEVESMRIQLEELKENSSIRLEDILRHSPPEFIEKLWAIIQFHKRRKPP